MSLKSCFAMQDHNNAALSRLLDTAAMQPPPAGSGRQSWPDYSKDAPPVHLPVEKDAVNLQVGISFVPQVNFLRTLSLFQRLRV